MVQFITTKTTKFTSQALALIKSDKIIPKRADLPALANFFPAYSILDGLSRNNGSSVSGMLSV